MKNEIKVSLEILSMIVFGVFTFNKFSIWPGITIGFWIIWFVNRLKMINQPKKSWEIMLEYASPDKLTEEEKQIIRNNVENLLAAEKIAKENPTGKARASAEIAKNWEEEFDEKYYDKNTPSGLNQNPFLNFKKMVDDIKSFISNLIISERKELIEKVEKMKVFTDYPNTIEGRMAKHENSLFNQALDEVIGLLKK